MTASTSFCFSGDIEVLASDANFEVGEDVNVRIELSVYGVLKRVHWPVGARTVRPRVWYGGGGLGDRERAGGCVWNCCDMG
jgi:hypothetical protein